MTRILQPSRAGNLPGLDTVQYVNNTWCDAAYTGGWRWLARYLPRSKTLFDTPDPNGGDFLGCWSLSKSEFEVIKSSKLGFVPIQWAPISGTPVTGGANAANNMVNCANWLGIPKGVHLWCDLEGSWAANAGTDGCLTYLKDWSGVIASSGYYAGLYIGQSIPLTGAQFYSIPKINAYWCSATLDARKSEPAPRGYSIFQGYGKSGTIDVAGIPCDPDMAVWDLRGGSFYLAL